MDEDRVWDCIRDRKCDFACMSAEEWEGRRARETEGEREGGGRDRDWNRERQRQNQVISVLMATSLVLLLYECNSNEILKIISLVLGVARVSSGLHIFIFYFSLISQPTRLVIDTSIQISYIFRFTNLLSIVVMPALAIDIVCCSNRGVH